MAASMSKTVSSPPLSTRQQIFSFLRRNSTQNTIKMTLIYLVLSISAFVISIPLVWMISTSLKDATQVFTWPIEWLPNLVTWLN